MGDGKRPMTKVQMSRSLEWQIVPEGADCEAASEPELVVGELGVVVASADEVTGPLAEAVLFTHGSQSRGVKMITPPFFPRSSAIAIHTQHPPFSHTLRFLSTIRFLLKAEWVHRTSPLEGRVGSPYVSA